MDEFDVKPILESLLFVSGAPVRLETLVEVLPEIGKDAIAEGLGRLKSDYGDDSKGIELVEVAGGYQFRTKPKLAEWVSRWKKVKAVKLSQSALETLAIVAYRQPVIRPEIEEVRGVDSGWVLRTLMEKGLVRMVGRRDLPGRPIIYGTTKAFLELFGLSRISDLPTLKEVQPPSEIEEGESGETDQVEAPPVEAPGETVEEAPVIRGAGQSSLSEPEGAEESTRESKE